MNEELTTKMHSEFTVSEITDIKHKCSCAVSDMEQYNYSIEKAALIYQIKIEDIQQFIKELPSK